MWAKNKIKAMKTRCETCGKKVKDSVNFCPYCGSNIIHNKDNTLDELKQRPLHQRKHKQEDSSPQAAQNQTQPKADNDESSIPTEDEAIPFADYEEGIEDYYAENKETFDNIDFEKAQTEGSPDADKLKAAYKDFKTQQKKKPKKKKIIGLWLMIYIFVNLIFAAMPPSDEQHIMLGFAFVITIIVAMRYKQKRPYNTFVKVIIWLKVALTTLLILAMIEESYLQEYALLLFFLLFTEIKMIFKGNNR